MLVFSSDSISQSEYLPWLERHGFSLASTQPQKGIYIRWDKTGPSLLSAEHPEWQPFRFDYESADFWRRIRSAMHADDLLIRAVGAKNTKPFILDATFGLGRDAFLLATWGCEVWATERNPTLFALAEYALSKITLVHPKLFYSEAQALELKQAPDVIYFDPMFALTDKKSSAKKDMQLLQLLSLDEENTSQQDLHSLSKKYPQARIVVKRALSSPEIALDRPLNSKISGKAIRFDIYLGK